MATAATALLNALVIGGTGATGKCLLGVLLRDKEHFGKVIVVTRRKLDSIAEEYNVNMAEEEQSGRLVQRVQDLDKIEKQEIIDLCSGCNVFFNTLGTTRSAAGSAQAFYHIDCEIPFKFAEAAKQAGVSHVSLLTSVGAKSSSFILYLRTKGELEDKVRALEFPHTSIFRPGGLNRGPTDRVLEKIVGFLVRGLPVFTLAAAMAWDAVLSAQKGQTSGDPSVTIHDSKRTFNEFAQEYQKMFAPKEAKEEKAKGSEPQPKEGEAAPPAQEPETAKVESKADETQPQAQPQAAEAQTQAEEPQPQAEEPKPQAEEPQPQTEKTQSQAEEDQTQLDPTQKEDTKPTDEESETNPEETQPEVDESPSQGEEPH